MKVIVICGPTASGKSKLAIELAKKINGEIINADSMQVYKGLNILSAKVSENDMQGIKHHLLSFLDLSLNYSVSDFQSDVRKCIADVNSIGKIPILVGGSGLYIKAALYDYSFTKENEKNMIDESLNVLSNNELYNYLQVIDKESTDKIHINNRKRVLRAISIYLNHGKQKSVIINQQNHELIYDCLFIGIKVDREILHENINNRVEKMIKDGLVEEVKNIDSINLTASKAIGYSLIKAYLDNKLSLSEAKEKMKILTRQYSKRQMTFFNNQFKINWFDYADNIIDDVYKYITLNIV